MKIFHSVYALNFLVGVVNCEVVILSGIDRTGHEALDVSVYWCRENLMLNQRRVARCQLSEVQSINNDRSNSHWLWNILLFKLGPNYSSSRKMFGTSGGCRTTENQAEEHYQRGFQKIVLIPTAPIHLSPLTPTTTQTPPTNWGVERISSSPFYYFIFMADDTCFYVSAQAFTDWCWGFPVR